MRIIRHMEMIQAGDGTPNSPPTKGRGVLHMEVDRSFLLTMLKELDKNQGSVTAMMDFPSAKVIITAMPDSLPVAEECPATPSHQLEPLNA